MWESPLKIKTPKQEKEKNPLEQELKKFKKPKCLISKASAKKVAMVKSVDSAGCFWLERWIDQLVRERSYPPQLKSDDFYSLLSRYFEPKVVLEILERVRKDYRQAFPLSEPVDEEDDLSWLSETLKADPHAIKLIPENYL